MTSKTHFLINTMTKDPTNLHDQDEECQSQKKEIKVNSLDLSTKNKSLAFNNTSSVPSGNLIEMQCYGNISICKTISMSLFLVCFLGTGGTYLATWWSNRSQGKQCWMDISQSISALFKMANALALTSQKKNALPLALTSQRAALFSALFFIYIEIFPKMFLPLF